MTNNFIFNEKLGHINIQNNIIIFVFLNLFYIKATDLSNNIILTKYINYVYSNWDNYNQDNNITFDIVNNDGLESEHKNLNELKVDLDNPDKFYSIYD